MVCGFRTAAYFDRIIFMIPDFPISASFRLTHQYIRRNYFLGFAPAMKIKGRVQLDGTANHSLIHDCKVV